MKKFSYIFIFTLFASCTSNTIFEKPKDLIPKDTMSLLLQEMKIAASSKHIKNKNLEKNINYMPLVYNKFKIDSTRFKTSNLYYMSNVDLYQEILEDVQNKLQAEKDKYSKIRNRIDSIRQDSIKNIKLRKPKKPLKKFENKIIKPKL